MPINLSRNGAPMSWPVADADLDAVAIIDMDQPLGPQVIRAAIAPRSAMDRPTLIAMALTGAALGLAAVSYLA